jgi:hypothetical protein
MHSMGEFIRLVVIVTRLTMSLQDFTLEAGAFMSTYDICAEPGSSLHRFEYPREIFRRKTVVRVHPVMWPLKPFAEVGVW